MTGKWWCVCCNHIETSHPRARRSCVHARGLSIHVRAPHNSTAVVTSCACSFARHQPSSIEARNHACTYRTGAENLSILGVDGGSIDAVLDGIVVDGHHLSTEEGHLASFEGEGLGHTAQSQRREPFVWVCRAHINITGESAHDQHPRSTLAHTTARAMYNVIEVRSINAHPHADVPVVFILGKVFRHLLLLDKPPVYCIHHPKDSTATRISQRHTAT